MNALISQVLGKALSQGNGSLILFYSKEKQMEEVTKPTTSARPIEIIKGEYAQICAQLGETTYLLECKEQEKKKLLHKMNRLHTEAFELEQQTSKGA